MSEDWLALREKATGRAAGSSPTDERCPEVSSPEALENWAAANDMASSLFDHCLSSLQQKTAAKGKTLTAQFIEDHPEIYDHVEFYTARYAEIQDDADFRAFLAARTGPSVDGIR